MSVRQGAPGSSRWNTALGSVLIGRRPAALAVSVLVSLSCVSGVPGAAATPGSAEPAKTAPAAGCTTPPAAAPPDQPAAYAVVLVVLDGVRWQEVFDGVDPAMARRYGLGADEVTGAAELMPVLHAALIDRGVAVGAEGFGPAMRASGPHYVSLPGYTEILTGRLPERCADNACSAVDEPTLADEVAVAAGGDGSAVIASWESLERAATCGKGEVLVSAGRHHGRGLDRLGDDEAMAALLAEGAEASSAPGIGDFRPDRFTAEVALRYLATRSPRFLFIGLGEPDEYAHRDDYRGYLDSLRAADRFIGRLAETLSGMGERGARTVVVVTTDHGRSDNFRDHGGFAPESGRVWLVAAGPGVRHAGLLGSRVAHRLADVAPTLRLLLGLAPDPRGSAGKPIEEALAL